MILFQPIAHFLLILKPTVSTTTEYWHSKYYIIWNNETRQVFWLLQDSTVVIAICMFNSNRVNFVTAILICPAKNDLISLFFNHFIMIIELHIYSIVHRNSSSNVNNKINRTIGVLVLIIIFVEKRNIIITDDHNGIIYIFVYCVLEMQLYWLFFAYFIGTRSSDGSGIRNKNFGIRQKMGLFWIKGFFAKYLAHIVMIYQSHVAPLKKSWITMMTFWEKIKKIL